MTAKQFLKLQTALGLTDAQLAEKLDVDRATVWRWKQGKVSKLAELALLYLSQTKSSTPA